MQPSSQAPAPRVGFFRAIWKAVRQVFHETTGTLFLLLAASWAAAALRQWRHGSPTWLWATCASFSAMMAVFGLTCFRSARRVR